MQNSLKMRKTIFLVLSVLWMGMIFCESAKPADVSAAESGWLVSTVGRLFIPGYENWDKKRVEIFVEKYDHPVRKAAHATEYAVLAILLFGALYKASDDDLPDKKRCAVAWLIGSLYAITDELHQIFVPGRSCEIKDMCIDSCGALAGVFLAFLAVIVIKYLIIKFFAENKA